MAFDLDFVLRVADDRQHALSSFWKVTKQAGCLRSQEAK